MAQWVPVSTERVNSSTLWMNDWHSERTLLVGYDHRHLGIPFFFLFFKDFYILGPALWRSK